MTIRQFSPTSLLNVESKIFMGILSKTTVTYFQSNRYADVSVQNAGIAGFL